MEKLTIRDIARMANVSTTAVSFVLNGRSGVSDATRERVQRIIRETGFTPNIHTRRLNLKHSFTVQVVMRQYDYSLFNLFAMDVLTGIFQEAKHLGYRLTFTTVGDQADCAALLETIDSRDTDGMIFIQVCSRDLILKLQQEGIPALCVDSHIPRDGSIPLIEVDYYDASYRAIRYLAQAGHRDIGFLMSDRHAEFYRSTLSGFRDGLRDAGLTPNPQWLQKVVHNCPTPVHDAMEQLLSAPRRPTAIFCASDTYAASAIQYATRMGLRAPEDLSFFGLDDLVISAYTRPAITTMGIDKMKMGALAMTTLYQMMNDEEFPRIQLLPTTLVERESVKRITSREELL